VLPDRLARSQALQDVNKYKIILKDKQEASDDCSKNKKASEEQKEVRDPNNHHLCDMLPAQHTGCY
jgi:hypothetical protein